MLKGFLSGLFWGGMVGALVLAVLSLYAPLPTSQADAEAGAQAPASAVVPTPEADVTGDDSEPNSQAAQDTSEGGDDNTEATGEDAASEEDQSRLTDTETETTAAVAVERVDVEDTLADDVTETAAPAQPLIEQTSPQVATTPEAPKISEPTDIEIVKLPQIDDGGIEAPQVPNAIAVETTVPTDEPLMVTDKPIATLPVAVLKTAPDGLGFADDVTVRTAPNLDKNADAAPRTVTTALVAPVVSELAPTPVENPKVVRVSVKPVPRTNSLPQVGGQSNVAATPVSADTPIGPQVGEIENPVKASALKVVTGRLPTVGSATPQVTQTTQTSAPAVDAPSQGALLDHAVEFQTNAQSLFSIVIIDVGTDGVPREQLLNSSYPITVAIDPSRPDAKSLMAQYRTAGIEVVALVNDLPPSAAPADVEVALAGYFDVVDEAVAVMEPLDKRLQRDRGLLQPLLGSIADTGHGLMTYVQGLNSTQQAAKREGVPSAAIFRVLDGEGENAPTIKRYLKRAAFNAGKDGSVVVVGRSLPNTMTAILEWALENNDASLSLAPISAILKTDLEQNS